MTKASLAVVVLLAGVGLLWLSDPLGTAPAIEAPRGERNAELAELQSPGGEASAHRAIAEGVEGVGEASAPARSAVVRVGGPGGEVLEGVALAWLEDGGRPEPLELDAAGVAPRPPGSEGARFFAWAPGRLEALAVGGASSQDVDLVLEPTRLLRGRVLEEGGFPSHSLFLRAFPAGMRPGLSVEEYELRRELERLGVSAPAPTAWTEADGSFVLAGHDPERGGSLLLPSTHVLRSGGLPSSDSRFTYGPGAQELLIDTLTLPTVTGRLVWSDDGAPVEGTLEVLFDAGTQGGTGYAYVQTSPAGEFRLGVPVREEALVAPSDVRAAAILHPGLNLRLDSASEPSGPFEERVSLVEAAFPLDLGTLQVPRAQRVLVRVVDPAGQPVEGAAVVTRIDGTHTDAEGRVDLARLDLDQLQVLARGFALAASSLASGSTDEVLLSLEPGSTLVLGVATEAPGASSWPVQLRWSEAPFEGAHRTGTPPYSPMPQRVHRVYHGRDMFGGSWSSRELGAPGRRSFRPQPNGEVVVPGLRAGSVFEVGLIDPLEQVLVSRRVQMPEEPGQHRVQLDADSRRTARLRLRLVDVEGRPIVRGSVLVGREDGRMKRAFGFEGGALDAGPFRPGLYSLNTQVSGYLPLRVEGHLLGSDAEPLELVLTRSRELAVRVLDEAGLPLAVREMSLWASSGWEAREHELALGQARLRVPCEPLDVAIRVGTRTYERTVSTEEEELLLTLPEHGGLRLEVPRVPDLMGGEGELVWTLEPVDGGEPVEGGEPVALEAWVEGGAAAPPLRLPLLAGAYHWRLELREWPGGDWEGEFETRPLARGSARVSRGVEDLVELPALD